MTMKSDFGALPIPLQRQILVRVSLSAASVVTGVGLLVLLRSATMAAPCLVAALLAAASGWHIYRQATLGRCLVLNGTVLKTEMSALRHRPKALLLEVDGKALRVVLRGRYKVLGAGTSVAVYIADTTPLYNWRGLHQLQTYLALVTENAHSGG